MVELPINIFLKPEDIGERQNVKFIDEGRLVEKGETGFDSDTFEINVMLPSGEKRSWTMNLTSQKAVARAFGIETAGWKDKTVTLITKDVAVKGQTRRGIFVEGEAKPSSSIS